MAKCNFCCKRTHLPFNCKFCTYDFCTHCRLQETHKCAQMDLCKSTKHMMLADTLKLQRTDKNKIEKI